MPKGSKLDEHRVRIMELLELGVSKTRIAKKYSVNPSSLHYWLNTRGAQIKIADATADQFVARLANEVYHIGAQEMERLEHAGVWIGNGHHASQNMQAEIMEKITPVIVKVVKAMVLR